MRLILPTLIGYLLGCLSPSALVSLVKHADIRKSGTKNLGATNTMLHFGKKFGFLVLGLDMAKTIAAYFLSKWLCPSFALAGLVGGSFAIIGHIFPFYMRFRGGKGLAALGGLVLAYSPLMFLVMLVVCTGLTLLFDHGVVMSYSASIIFPIWAGFRSGDVAVFAITALVGLVIMWKHTENIRWAREHTDGSVRHYLLGWAKSDEEE